MSSPELHAFRHHRPTLHLCIFVVMALVSLLHCADDNIDANDATCCRSKLQSIDHSVQLWSSRTTTTPLPNPALKCPLGQQSQTSPLVVLFVHLQFNYYFPHFLHALSTDLRNLLLMPFFTCFSTDSMFRIPQQVFCDCLSSCLYLSTHLCGNHRRPFHKCPWCLSTHGTCIHDASTSATESLTHLLLPSRISSKEVPEPLLFCHGFSRVGTR